MSVEYYLARRYLLDRRHGAWGWLISSIATGSVALGVAALIVTLAVMTGFREDIRQKMLGINPHITLTSFNGKLVPDDPFMNQVFSKVSEVKVWSPYITGQILIGRGKNSSGATIKGIHPETELQVAHMNQKLVKGEWADIEGSKEKPPIVLGQELARRIGARVGDIIWVITSNSIGIATLSVPQAHLFEVVGLLNTGLYDYDLSLAYTNIPAAQKLFNLESQVSGIGIRIKDPEGANEIADQLRTDLEGRYWVRSWLFQNKNLFSALKLERTVMFIILALLTVVAAFMIISNLLLNITQKVKEIGILRAMGATPQTIRRIFLLQGLLMGVVGNGLGVLLGLGLSTLLKETNLIRLPADVYYIDHLPIRVLPLDVLSVIVLAGLIVLVAVLYPAQKAAKLDPLDAIRYG